MSHRRGALHFNPKDTLWLCGSICFPNKCLSMLKRIAALALCPAVRFASSVATARLHFKERLSHGATEF
jgi:hypothetical protein